MTRPSPITPESEAGLAARLAAVLVHGRGRLPDEMRSLAGQIGLDERACVFPAAPGASWYPLSFLAPLEQNEPDLSESLGAYEAIVAGLIAAGTPPERILLGGFSQGACLTAQFLARHPRPYAGALIFTGGLIGPPGTLWPEQTALAGVPVFVTTSQIDEWVPPARVEETAAWLRRSGAAVTMRIYADRPHVVGDDEIAEAASLVARLRQAAEC